LEITRRYYKISIYIFPLFAQKVKITSFELLNLPFAAVRLVLKHIYSSSHPKCIHRFSYGTSIRDNEDINVLYTIYIFKSPQT